MVERVRPYLTSARGINAASLQHGRCRSRICFCLVLGRQRVFRPGACTPHNPADSQANLKEGSRAGDARGSQRARSLLAAAEVAVAMILLVGAGLLMRSFARLLSVSPGFETENMVKAEISLPRFQYSRPEQWTAFYQ